MTTKNSIEPKVLAMTKVLIERTWVLQMNSAVPLMPETEHALAARAVDAQFLGALGNRVVVLLQLVFGVAGGHETLHALALGVGLDRRCRSGSRRP